eukprot:PhF_6_TR23290/c2_g3_i2/m.32823
MESPVIGTPTAESTYVFIGLHQTVVALNKNTGAEVWRTVLLDTWIQYGHVTLLYDFGMLYAALCDTIYRLNPLNGTIETSFKKIQRPNTTTMCMNRPVTMESPSEVLLFVGSGVHVEAFDIDGVKKWSTAIDASWWAVSAVTMLYQDQCLYVGCRGRTYKMNALNGQLIWTNDLKGLGHASVCLSSVASTQRIMPPREGDPHNNYVFAGIAGYVVALDMDNGTEVWRTSLPGSGWMMVDVCNEYGVVYAGSGGRLYSLCPATGTVNWKSNALRGGGLGSVSLNIVYPTSSSSKSKIVVSGMGYSQTLDAFTGAEYSHTSLPYTGYMHVAAIPEGPRSLCASNGKAFLVDNVTGG